MTGALASAVRHDVMDWAAALGFYFLFSLFPGVLMVGALLSMLRLGGLVQALVAVLGRDLPAGAGALVARQLGALVAQPRTGVFSFGFLLMLYSASQGVSGLMAALNAAYGIGDRRSWMHRLALAVVLALGAGLLVGVALLALVFGEKLLELLAGPAHAGFALRWLWPAIRWGVVLAAMTGALWLLYRFAPDGGQAHRRPWPAVVTALVLWAAGSVGLALYINHFANYSRLYGALGAIIALMLWFYLLGLALLLGAEVHAQLLAPAPPAERPQRRAA